MAGGSVDLKTLPGPDWLLANTGKRDGENKIIREGNSAVVYMWSAVSEKWEKVRADSLVVLLLAESFFVC